MDNLFSFAVQPGDVTDTLKSEIEKIVRSDVKSGPGKAKLQATMLDDDTPEYLTRLAIDQIYNDVLDFQEWYFNRLSDRMIDLNTFASEAQGISGSLRNAVKNYVEDELAQMRLGVSTIPLGVDSPDLADLIADKLSKYIVTWQQWFWYNLRQERIDDYYELMGVNNEIYDDEYGDLSNSYGGFLDGVSDVPYLSKELGFTGE